MIRTIRAKMRLNRITSIHGTNNKAIRFDAIRDNSTEENRMFTKYTPSGHFEIYCNNPVVLDSLELGKCYYFEISEAS